MRSFYHAFNFFQCKTGKLTSKIHISTPTPKSIIKENDEEKPTVFPWSANNYHYSATFGWDTFTLQSPSGLTHIDKYSIDYANFYKSKIEDWDHMNVLITMLVSLGLWGLLTVSNQQLLLSQIITKTGHDQIDKHYTSWCLIGCIVSLFTTCTTESEAIEMKIKMGDEVFQKKFYMNNDDFDTFQRYLDEHLHELQIDSKNTVHASLHRIKANEVNETNKGNEDNQTNQNLNENECM